MSLPLAHKPFVLLESLVDPRMNRNRRHKLVDILVIALCGFLGGCEGWVDVEMFGISKHEWFETFLELPNGIPSHDTFGRVFALLDPQQLTGALSQFVQAVVGPLREAVAIDGKTLARSGENTTGKQALHLVSAWATERGVVLGQMATANHSNEITAIPRLLQLLDIRGTVVTIDAAGCQKAIVRQVRAQGGDYVLAVKGNQKNLQEVVQFQLGRGHSNVARSKLKTRDKNHGRTEQRTYTTMAAPTAVRRHWLDAQSIVRVCRETTTDQGRKTKQVRDFISSLPPQVERLASLIRGHWGIENQLHWSLDVTFNEDQSRIRQGRAAENAALLRRLALSILKQDTWYTDSLRCKRLRAGWENRALEHFLKIFSEN